MRYRAGGTADRLLLSQQLATTSGQAFALQALPLLRLLAYLDQNVVVEETPLELSPEIGWFASSAVVSDAINLPLETAGKHSRFAFQAIVCLGFYEGERERTNSVCQNLPSLILEHVPARPLLILHNQEERDPDFRTLIRKIPQLLQPAGQRVDIEVWNRKTLLDQAFSAVGEYLEMSLMDLVEHPYDALDEEPQASSIEHVPVEILTLDVDAYSLRDEQRVDLGHRNPAEELLKKRPSGYSILLGEFGSGKTTTAVRALESQPGKIIFVPASSLSNDIVSTKDMLYHSVQGDKIVDGLPLEDKDILKSLVRSATEKILDAPGCSFTLLYDALDESPLLRRDSGLQQFFQMLSRVKSPVIMTARTEFWEQRRPDFQRHFGLMAQPGKNTHKRRHHHMVRLLPWDDHEIIALTEQFLVLSISERERGHLSELLLLLRSGDYTKIYGDIPRRPLFLRCLIESVRREGVRAKHPSELLDEWAWIKIRRDWENPRRLAEGRIPIAPGIEDVDENMHLSFRAMEAAAFAMLQPLAQGTSSPAQPRMDLFPSCRFESLAHIDPLLSIMTSQGLTLNSLLLPTGQRRGTTGLNLKFAHRAFQELFLARFLLRRPNAVAKELLPSDILRWMGEVANWLTVEPGQLVPLSISQSPKDSMAKIIHLR
jgi:hypothetical protein